MSAVEILEEIHTHGASFAAEFADRIAAKSTEDGAIVITPEMMSIEGGWAAQGDVNFIFLKEIPKGAIAATPVGQLAPGTSRGSRHCVRLADRPHVDFFQLPNSNPLEGLILRFNAPTTIEHPEHKHHLYPEGAIVAVAFQRKYAEELKRIQD